jgi:hypothetical protein
MKMITLNLVCSRKWKVKIKKAYDGFVHESVEALKKCKISVVSGIPGFEVKGNS